MQIIREELRMKVFEIAIINHNTNSNHILYLKKNVFLKTILFKLNNL